MIRAPYDIRVTRVVELNKPTLSAKKVTLCGFVDVEIDKTMLIRHFKVLFKGNHYFVSWPQLQIKRQTMATQYHEVIRMHNLQLKKEIERRILEVFKARFT